MTSITRSLISLTLLCLLLTGFGLADIGVKAGLNFASQRQGGFEMQGAQAKILAGVLFPLKINEIFTVQPEVFYVQKGSEKVREESSARVTTKLNALDIVLLSKFYLGNTGSLKPHLLFGPFVSFLLSGTYIYGDGDFEESIDDYHKLEYGYTVGVGSDVFFGKMKLSIDLRFSHSLTDVHNVPTRIWNKGFSFSVGYFFGTK